jgi:DNA-binding winged helix-turn-helix (wHTH) protein
MAIPNPFGAVFVSHASEDEVAAMRVAAALRAAGVEVWIDRSNLKGGDAWDHGIRQQLRDCALFIAVISRHTTRRPEAYFRLEWHLADQRTLLMARSKAFIVPVCIDDTTEAEAEVPESFRAVQWTRLTGNTIPPAFGDRIRSLMQPPAGMAARASYGTQTAAVAGTLPATGAADVITLGPFALDASQRRLLRDGHPVELGARAFDLLQVLVEQPGRLVTKGTLFERVWPNLVVDENNLPAQIASLRRVLGAAAIRTVPGFGYRLELEVVRPTVTVPPMPVPATAAAPALALAPLPAHLVTSRLTPLIGRASDQQALHSALDRARCVTVVGGAGIGKTRLAQEAFARTIATGERGSVCGRRDLARAR